MKLGTTLASCVIALSAIVPAAAQEPGPFTVSPAPGSQSSTAGDYYVLDARPGAVVRQGLRIRNTSREPLTVTVAPVDAFTDPSGSVGYRPTGQDLEGVGAWISIRTREWRIPPEGIRRVPFRVRVPRDAPQGVNLGALSIQIPSDASSGRVVVAVQVNTPGRVAPELFVTGVTARAGRDALFLDVGLENRGSDLASGNGLLLLPESGFESPIELDTFLPRSSITHPIRWTREATTGTYAAEVSIEYGGGQVATWSGEFTIGEGLVEVLADPGGPGRLPWLLLIVGGAAVAAGAFYLGKLRARTTPVTPGAEEGATLATAEAEGEDGSGEPQH